MHVESTKVRSKSFLLFNSDVLEILTAEDYDASLGNEQCKLIFLDIGQLRKLKAFDFRSNARSKFCNLQFGVLRIQKVWLCFVCLQSTIDELKRFGGWEGGGFIVDREIVVVFVLCDN